MKNDWQVGAVYVIRTRKLWATGRLTALTPAKLMLGDAVYEEAGEMQCGVVWIDRAAITYAYRQIVQCTYVPIQLPLHEAVTN
jgi:hypothetical protein